MKLVKNFIVYFLLLCMATGCKKDQFGDLSLLSTVGTAGNVSVMFNVTHDNTGIVTITPNATGVSRFDVFFGDATTAPVSVAAGKSVNHTYPEGNYSVKVIAYDLKGGSATVTQPLVVSFLAPQNLAVTLTQSSLTVSLKATAKYATLFKAYFGDSTNIVPQPVTSFLAGQTVNHTYPGAGTYYIKVVALSGGSETTEFLDTVKVGKQINLPVTFDDAATDYAMSDFGGNASVLSVDPANSGNHVMKSVKTSGAQVWAGTTIGTGLGFSSPIPLNATATKMTVMVYSPAAGLDIKLKLDNHTNPNNGLSVETDVKTTVANTWETLTFDFSKNATGTPAFSASNTYDLASIFFDFGNAGSGSVFYFDNLMLAPLALKQIDLPVTFDDASVDYTVTDFGGNNSSIAADPTNAGNNVLKAIKTSGAQVWAGTTIGTASGFATLIPISSGSHKMTASVYSPAAGLHIRLKLEDHNDGTHSVETEAITTVANQWETLTFDFSSPASGTASINGSYHYDKASVFFDFGNGGTGSTFYLDNLKLVPGSGGGGGGGGLTQVSLPVTFDDATVDYTVTDFGSNSSVLTTDPTNAGNHVMQTTKTVGAQTWAGTTIGNGQGFSSKVPFTASSTKMSVKVYSPAAGLHIRLKVEDHGNNTHTVETEAITTVANQWETLTFDFKNQAAGTATLDLSYNLDMASIFFDFGNTGTGAVFYWDDVKFL